MITNVVKLTIKGQPVRKSNSRIVSRGYSRKSVRTQAYYKSFVEQVPDDLRLGLDGPISVFARLYYSPQRTIRGKLVRAKISNQREAYRHSWVGDLSIEAILDCLEASGVIENDRNVIFFCAWKGVSFDNPRAEITIKEHDIGSPFDFAFEPAATD